MPRPRASPTNSSTAAPTTLDAGIARHSHLRPLAAEPALTNSSPTLSRKD